MTTERPTNGSERPRAAVVWEQVWAECTRNVLDNYPYDAIQILVYIMNEGYEVQVHIRPNLPQSVKGETDTQPGAQPRVATMLPPRRHNLLEGADFHVINRNCWEDTDPADIELDARMAESFGLLDLAAFARERIR